MKTLFYNPGFVFSDCELRSYFLGYWLADGWQDNQGYVRISSSDEEIITQLVTALEFTNKVSVTKNYKYENKSEPTGKNQYHLSFGVRGPIHDLINSEGYPIHKTGNEFIPSCISDLTFRHFMRGLTDGDGSFHLVDNGKRLMYSIVSASKSFLVSILQRLRLGSVIAAPNVHVCKGIGCYHFSLGHVDSVRLGNYLYKDATIKMERKFRTYLAGELINRYHPRKLWTLKEIEQLKQGISVLGRSKSSCSNKLARLLAERDELDKLAQQVIQRSRLNDMLTNNTAQEE